MLIDLINSGKLVHQFHDGVDSLVNVSHLRDYTVFDCNEVAAQIITSIERFTAPEKPGKPVFTMWKFTENADKVLGGGTSGQQESMDWGVFANLILPYPHTWFEYDMERFMTDHHPHRYITAGIALSDASEQITKEMRTEGVRTLLCCEFYNLYQEAGFSGVVNEDDAFVMVGDEGVYLGHYHTANTTFEQRTPLVISLLTLMMLNFRQLTGIKKTVEKPSRQQRRHAERKNIPLYIPVDYHVLTINTELPNADAPTDDATDSTGGHKRGWENAWHTVRQHRRTYQNGRITIVRSHHRGNPFKGISWKDYAVR